MDRETALTKVPAVTLGFWIIKIAATTLGETGGALVFLAALAALFYRTGVSRVALFLAAFILTRPFGATVGDFLDKLVSHGGLDLSRPVASAVLATFIVGAILAIPQRASRHPGTAA